MTNTTSNAGSEMKGGPAGPFEMMAEQFEMMARLAAIPGVLEARASATPQQAYFDLAAKCPVSDLGDNMYSVLNLEDILYVTKHRDVVQHAKYLGSDRPAIPLGIDGEEHRKYRRLIDPIFTAKNVAPLAEPVRILANEMIDGFIEQGHVNAHKEWCEPLPATIFLRIMGLPMKDLEQFIHFKTLTLGSASLDNMSDKEREQQMAERMEAVMWIHDYFNRDLDAREQEGTPRDDLIGQMLTSEVEGNRLTRDEVLDILGLFMIAGLDTVAASIACFLSYFARHADERRRIVENPELLHTAIEELMRFESPVTDGFRTALKEVRLPSGTVIPAGGNMHISWPSGNLDPNTFENPLTVDFERAPNPHIGFACGYHRCLGSHLARMEMYTALVAWHERIPDYHIEPGVELVYSGNPRAPHLLPLVWG